MRDVVIVGAGFAGREHWIPAVRASGGLRLVGVVDTSPESRAAARSAAGDGIWIVPAIGEIPAAVSQEAIIFVVTPDHFPVIAESLANGYRNLVIEKPLVSRDEEVALLKVLIAETSPRIYAVDHYFQKFFALEFVLGRVALSDPRVALLAAQGDHPFNAIPGCLGQIEGLSAVNIEAGDLGIPYLDGHPWLEHDPVIGGILRDLGPHALNPLTRLGLIGPEIEFYDVGLAKLTRNRAGLEPDRVEIEMYVRVLLVSRDVTINLTFGKAPFRGKERSLAVRGERGSFFAGLARGQHAVLMTNDGRTTRLQLTTSENQFVVEEARLFHEGLLPGFDGNLGATFTALEAGQKIREAYFASRG